MVLGHQGQGLLDPLDRGVALVDGLGRVSDASEELTHVFEGDMAAGLVGPAGLGVEEQTPGDGVGPGGDGGPREEAPPGVVHLEKGLLEQIFGQVRIAGEAVEVSAEPRSELVVDHGEGGGVSLGVARHGLVGPRRCCTLTHGLTRSTGTRGLRTHHQPCTHG